MQHDFHTNLFPAMRQTQSGGLAVRTGLRGGVCVDVNDQVEAALQTLTDALAGTTSMAAAPAATSAPAVTTS